MQLLVPHVMLFLVSIAGITPLIKLIVELTINQASVTLETNLTPATNESLQL